MTMYRQLWQWAKLNFPLQDQAPLMRHILKRSQNTRTVYMDCITKNDRLYTVHEKFLQFDWLRAVIFQLNLKYLHVKITNL